MPASVRRQLKKIIPVLIQAREANLNEADTVQRIIKVFEEVLGYDLLTEISREANLKNKFVDITLKIDGVTKLLVEAKAAGVTLRDRHIEQAQSYASRNNYRWVLLTNGIEWNLYHLTFDEGIEYERAFTINLAEGDINECADRLSYLHRTTIKRGKLEAFWTQCQALSAASIGKALFRDEVIRTLRRAIRRTEGVLIDPEDLVVALSRMLAPDVREQVGPPRLRRAKAPRSQPRTRAPATAKQPTPGQATN